MELNRPLQLEEIMNEDARPQNLLVRWNSVFADWTMRTLSSLLMFDIAIITPIFGIGNEKVELWLLIVSNWIQWWALPVLQRSQNRIQGTQLAMAKMDHRNVVYMMDVLEDQSAQLEALRYS